MKVLEFRGRTRTKKVLQVQGMKRKKDRCSRSTKVGNRKKERKDSRKGFDHVESSLVVDFLVASLVV
jgi:hypothetical protein